MCPGHGSFVLAITLAIAAPAAAHVAPSRDDNNRYLKLTPTADGLRLAYTVFFGEVPGAQLRRTLDADHDGRIAEAEAQAFGDRLAAEVAAGLELAVDGEARPITWTTVAVGMGTPRTAAGAFSVDLVHWACVPAASGRHTVLVRDRFRLPRAGETEVKVEDARGITIERARIGGMADPEHAFRFVGPGGPLADDGLELAFTASEHAPRTGAGACAGGPTRRERTSPGRVVAGAAITAIVLAGAVVLARRRRRGRASPARA